MTRGLIIAAVACFAVSLATGEASAATNFRDRDANKDGVISRAEFENHHLKKFKEMDLDKDGFLTINDLEHSKGKLIAGIGSMLGKTLFKAKADKYRAMDLNKDERISSNEYVNSRRGQFLDMDMNGDSSVSAQEFSSFKSKKRQG